MNTQFRMLLILASVAAATLRVEAKPWRGVEPLRSTRADVIRLFNQCKDDLHICSFELEREHVSIYFSRPLHTGLTRYTCVKELPLGTVLRIEVVPKGSLRFSKKDFGQNRPKSFDHSPRRTRNFKAYLDKKSGILINTQQGKVAEMIYFATSSDSHLCQSYYMNPEEFIAVEHFGMPPLVSLDCPKTAQESEISLTAHTYDDPELLFLWNVSAGKVVKGQYTDTVTIDVAGLSGQTIEVITEVFSKSGLDTVATCKIRIHSQRP